MTAHAEPAVMPTYGGRLPVVLARGEGMRLWGPDGTEYLDFAAGIGTMPLGHSHPRWVEAVRRQAAELVMVSNLYFTQPQADLAQTVVDRMELGDAQVFFSNSGAEANEALLKLVRKWGLAAGRPRIVALEGSFHGRTVAALASTGQPGKRAAFEPLLDWFDFVPPNDLAALDVAVGGGTAAVFLEPVMGEGGVIPLSDDYLRAARDLTSERGALLAADEVQAGTGRCGAWRSSALAGVTPDVVSLAKGLGGGLPIGATVARADLAFAAGDHASTFGGGPLVCTAALETIAVIEDEGLLDNALKQGERIRRDLAAAFEGDDRVADVRGRGLLIGVELAGPWAKDVVGGLIERGLLVTEASPGVVRLSPPLIVSEADADAAIDMLTECIRELRP